MKLSLLITTSLIALLCAPAQAQPRKCTAPDGKVTYSDVACPDSTRSERSVDTRANVMDSSELREKVQRDKAAAAHNAAMERERAAEEAKQTQTQAAQAARQNALNADKERQPMPTACATLSAKRLPRTSRRNCSPRAAPQGLTNA